MHIFQSTLEKALYWLIFFIFLSQIVVGVIAFREGQQINRILNNHTSTIAKQAEQTQQIIDNQMTNSIAIKQYIACLLTLNPTQTPAQIAQAEAVCFNNAPQVK